MRQKYQAENRRKRKRRIRKNAEGNVESKDHSFGWRRRQSIRRRQMGRQKKHKNEGQNKRTHGSLPMKKLQTQVGQRQKPPKKRHRSVQIVIRNGVQATRPFQQRKIVRNKPQSKE